MSFTYCVHAGALRGQEKMLSVLELQLTDNGESTTLYWTQWTKSMCQINTPFFESVFSFFQWLKYHVFICVLKTR